MLHSSSGAFYKIGDLCSSVRHGERPHAIRHARQTLGMVVPVQKIAADLPGREIGLYPLVRRPGLRKRVRVEVLMVAHGRRQRYEKCRFSAGCELETGRGTGTRDDDVG